MKAEQAREFKAVVATLTLAGLGTIDTSLHSITTHTLGGEGGGARGGGGGEKVRGKLS